MNILILLATIAASGDVIYTAEGTPGALTGPQKTLLGNAAALAFPDVAPATLDTLKCVANPKPELWDSRAALDLTGAAALIDWSCTATDSNPALTPEQILAAELADSDCEFGDVVDCGTLAVSAAAKTSLGVFTTSAFGRAIGRMWSFACKRNTATPTQIDCTHRWVKIANATIWNADKASKTAKRLIGKVQ